MDDYDIVRILMKPGERVQDPWKRSEFHQSQLAAPGGGPMPAWVEPGCGVIIDAPGLEPVLVPMAAIQQIALQRKAPPKKK